MGNTFKRLMIAGALLGLVGVITIIGAVIWYFGVQNTEVALTSRHVAAVDNREAVLDNMTKQIMEKYGLSKEYAVQMKDLIAATVRGREGGGMLKFVTEQNPNLDTTIHKEVMATISGKRDEFTRSQQVILDIEREHSNLLKQAPSKWVVGGREALVSVVISSSGTKSKVETGIDDDVLIGGD